MIIIYKMTLFHLVIRHLYASSQFGQNHDFDIFIFQIDYMITLLLTSIFYLFNNRIWINDSTTTLIYPLLKKHGIFLGFTDSIGRKKNILLPNFYFFNHVLSIFLLILFLILLMSFLLFQANLTG